MTTEPTHIRAMHPYAFRAGQWAEILTTVISYGRECWLVEFSDGETDWWPLGDQDAEYEFCSGVPA